MHPVVRASAHADRLLLNALESRCVFRKEPYKFARLFAGVNNGDTVTLRSPVRGLRAAEGTANAVYKWKKAEGMPPLRYSIRATPARHLWALGCSSRLPVQVKVSSLLPHRFTVGSPFCLFLYLVAKGMGPRCCHITCHFAAHRPGL